MQKLLAGIASTIYDFVKEARLIFLQRSHRLYFTVSLLSAQHKIRSQQKGATVEAFARILSVQVQAEYRNALYYLATAQTTLAKFVANQIKNSRGSFQQITSCSGHQSFHKN